MYIKALHEEEGGDSVSNKSATNISNKSITYRIYPNTKQQILLNKTFGCCRKVWNLMLAGKISSYQQNGTFGKQTPAMYKEEYPYLKEVDSLALANVQLNLQQALKNCFESKHCRFPVYKSSKHNRKSYTTNNQKGTIEILDKGIKLPKVGIIKAKIHRKPMEEWKLKSATVRCNGDDTYEVSVLFEYENVVQKVPADENTTVGLDYKSDGLYMDSDGKMASMPHFYRQSQKTLAKAQRKLKHKKIGSNNYKKQQKRIAKIQRHTANQRKDFLHKQSTEIANQYSCICVESLNMKAMSNRGFRNGKATMDNGYGMFLNMLEYKLKDRGKTFVKVDKWYPSSQICHNCGSMHPEMKDLSRRIMKCDCGCIIDRDQNAAINIKAEGLRIAAE